MVQLWYPATAGGEEGTASYVDDGRMLRPLARLMGLPERSFDELDRVRTHAIPGAAVADAETRYPVVVFSHGRCGYRQHNTVQVEELVSHGFAVATIDHPYAATGVVFPDGHRVLFDDRLLPPWPWETLPGDDGEVQRAALSFLAADVGFVLDQLAAVDAGESGGPLAGRLDLTRVGALGVSLGAMVLTERARLDRRIRSIVSMDAPMPATVVADGLQVPAMWLSRDAETMEREGWSQRDVVTTQRTMHAVFDGLAADGYLVLVPGMFHPDFSDGRLLSPLLPERGLTGPIDGARARTILNAYSVAFFDRHLRNRHSPLLDGPAAAFPDVRLERHTSRRPVGMVPG
jgi:dienelactone hydrolase